MVAIISWEVKRVNLLTEFVNWLRAMFVQLDDLWMFLWPFCRGV